MQDHDYVDLKAEYDKFDDTYIPFVRLPKEVHNSSNCRLFEIMVSEYNSRMLTYLEDALNAIQGLLSEFKHTMFTTGFHFGLPLINLRRSLGWMVTGLCLGEARRSSFPTWSWSGWQTKQAITFDNIEYDGIQPPLGIWTPAGDPITDYRPDQPSNTDTGTGMIASLTGSADRVRDNRVSPIVRADIEQLGTNLTVQGIVLQLRITTTSEAFILHSRYNCQLHPKMGTSLEGCIQLNFDRDEIVGGDHSRAAQLHLDGSQRDLLWLNVRDVDGRVYIALLYLRWKDGIAYRKGHVSAWHRDHSCLEFLHQANPRLMKFQLG